jgi:sugar phosphate isomerase/epimerase
MTTPRIAVYEMTTPASTFQQDLDDYVAARVNGIGICEFKLVAGQDANALDALQASGLGVASCLPVTDSFLSQTLLHGTPDHRDRLRAMCASVHRLAAFRPGCVICTTGPIGSLDPAEAEEIVVNGLRQVGRVAEAEGLRVALEPLHVSLAADWSFISTLPEAVRLIDAAGSPALGVLFDTWHLADTPGIADQVRSHVARIFGVHVSDRRKPTRGWCDRALPGSGSLDLPGLLRALNVAGYQGWYDLEIFSDNGRFGTAYPDSLWDLPTLELVSRAREGLIRAWAAGNSPPSASDYLVRRTADGER